MIPFDAYREAVANALGKFSGETNYILDLCCGTGDLAEIMQKFSSDITGVDFSENMLELARKRLPALNFINGKIIVLFLVLDMEKLLFFLLIKLY